MSEVSDDDLPQPDSIERPKIEALVKKALNDLAEHFEALVIFGTFTTSDGESVRYYNGKGNRYARYGMIKDWVNQQDRE